MNRGIMRNIALMLKEARSKFPIGTELALDGYLCTVGGYGAICTPKLPGHSVLIEAVTLMITGHPFLYSVNFEFISTP